MPDFLRNFFARFGWCHWGKVNLPNQWYFKRPPAPPYWAREQSYRNKLPLVWPKGSFGTYLELRNGKLYPYKSNYR